MTGIVANSDIFGLSEQHYGKIKRVGMLNDEPILYGDPNLLKNNDLYYIIGAKQVYRYVKCEVRHTGGASSPGILNPTPIPVEGNVFDPNATTKEYYFETFNGSDSEVLSVPEDERGKIRNAGYLFNEIIYSGDPNLVDNGQLFYHDTLPYISVISNVDGIINVSTKTIRFDGTTGTIVNEYRVSPEPHDYSKDYLTFEALEDGTIKLQYNNLREDADGDDEYYELITEGIDIDNNYIEYSTDNGNSWIKLTQVNWDSATIVVSKGDKVLTRGVNNTFYVNGSSYLNIFSFLQGTSHIKVYGNIKTIYGEQELEQNCFSWLFGNYSNLNKSELLVDAQYLVLPYTTLASNCYSYMFYTCTSLTTAPVLPATTLVNYCYQGMLQGCGSLRYIKMMATNVSATNCLLSWVSGVASTGTFVKNSAATWDVSGDNGIPTGWTVETADS